MADDKGLPAQDFERHKMHSEQLVTLAIAAVETAQAWLKFLITVEAALATGFGFLALGQEITFPRLVLALIICFFGAGLARILADVIVRHQRWQGWFIKKHVAVLDNSTAVFPTPVEPEPMPTTIAEIKTGVIGEAVGRIQSGLVGAWAIAAVLMILRFADKHAGLRLW